MKRVLTGSQALFYWKRLKRKPSDFDILWEKEKQSFKKNNCFIDANNFETESTNLILAKRAQNNPEIDTPIGKCVVLGLKEIKIMKLSSLPLNKNKNLQDLKLLEDIELDSEDLKIVEKRTEDTILKMKNRSSFFNKYKVKRYFDHDQLHIWVNPNPLYRKILKDNSFYEVCEDKFQKLPLLEKIELIREEVFVLALERSFIPKIMKNPLGIDTFCEKFYLTDKSSDPSIYWLDRFSTNLKDNPQFLADFAKNNYFLILSRFGPWWGKTFDNLSEDFWIEAGF